MIRRSLSSDTPRMTVPDQIERDPSDGWAVVAFESPQAFEAWLKKHHGDEPGVWVKFAKKGTGIPSVTLAEAIEVALCFGWIDSLMHRYDDNHYVLRYSPRKSRSNWSARNKELAERLISEGRMQPPGLAQVQAAKADGRWDAT
jgi:uncharacterized protein YdeI (YjbR/CyaY-like superfamily)